MGMSSALVLTMALASTALGAAFQNGDFENVNGTNGQNVHMVMPGQPDVTGWDVSGHSVDIVKGRWPAHSGAFSIDLNGLGPGAISQKLDTRPGKHYFVAFQMAGNPDGPYEHLQCYPGTTKSMTVTIDGGQGQEYTFSTAGHSLSDVGWTLKAYTFTAKDAKTSLKFKSTTPDSACGPIIDTVSVTQVSATGVNCKNGGWRDLTDSLGNRFRNQGDCVSFHATGERNLANPRD
jgi:choice-of-anchor C domain-containing protein